MTEVHARRGPLAGRRVDIPEADVEAATGKDGWAQKLEPGTVLETDTSAPIDPKWKIPGYEHPETADAPAKPAKAADHDEPASSRLTGRPTARR